MQVWDLVTHQWFTQEYSSSATLQSCIESMLWSPHLYPFLPDCWMSIISLLGDRYVAARSCASLRSVWLQSTACRSRSAGTALWYLVLLTMTQLRFAVLAASQADPPEQRGLGEGGWARKQMGHCLDFLLSLLHPFQLICLFPQSFIFSFYPFSSFSSFSLKSSNQNTHALIF